MRRHLSSQRDFCVLFLLRKKRCQLAVVESIAIHCIAALGCELKDVECTKCYKWFHNVCSDINTPGMPGRSMVLSVYS